MSLLYFILCISQPNCFPISEIFLILKGEQYSILIFSYIIVFIRISQIKTKLSRIITNAILSKIISVLIIIYSYIITEVFSMERYQILFVEMLSSNIILWLFKWQNKKRQFYYNKIKFKL